MTRSRYQVEKTAIGLQYVIPGTKRIVKPKPQAFKADWTMAASARRPVETLEVAGVESAGPFWKSCFPECRCRPQARGGHLRPRGPINGSIRRSSGHGWPRTGIPGTQAHCNRCLLHVGSR